MAVIVGSARSDENGQAYGGRAGDQTGREVSTQNWYAHSKGWVLLRARDAGTRDKIARCMQAACDNPCIGYDQYERNSLYNAAQEFGFDVSKVTKNVECDCSALVRVCCAYAGITVPVSFRTTDEASALVATGAFDKFTDDLHCRKSTNLLRGDILVTKTQGHTVVVLSDGENAAQELNPPALGSRLLKKGSTGADVRELQDRLIRLGYDVGASGADGDFGKATEEAVKAFQAANGLKADGEYGKKTDEALTVAWEKAQENPDKQSVVITGDCVNIRCGNGTQYAIVAMAGKDMSFEFVATALNGWHAVVVSGQVGWVSGKYSRTV